MIKKHILAPLVAALATPALALDKLPDKAGFSGYVNLGGSVGAIESNFLSGLPDLEVDLGDERIDDFGSPDDEDFATVALGLNLNYTFSNLKTQVSLGNDLADFLQFDRSTLLSLRHDLDTVGRMQVSLLSTPLLATEVWEDPYVLGEKRRDTERSTTGGRFTWDRILGSMFELKVESKKIELDDERSGEWLDLSDAERRLLDREGDIVQVELGYLISLGDGENLLRPSVTFVDRDLDGDAMAQDGYEVALSWLYNPGQSIRLVNNLSYSSLDGDERNPIFNEVHDSEAFVYAGQVFFPGLFGLEHWEPNVSFVYGDLDSDIDFNDAAGWMVSLSMGRQF